MDQLERNILGLKWMVEDYGQLVDTALEAIIKVCENPDVPYDIRLELSECYNGEKFWDSVLQYSYENFLETGE